MDSKRNGRKGGGPWMWAAAAMCCLIAGPTPASAQSGAHAGDAAASLEMHEAMRAAQHGEANKALELAKALVVKHPGYEPGTKFKAALLEQMGQGAEAEAAYERALKLAPGDVEVVAKVGVYKLLAGDYDSAIGLFHRVMKQSPRDGDTLYYLAQAYHLKGDNELALKAIERSVKLEPENASVWQKYGELLCSSGNNEAAIRWLLKAQHADPTLERIDFDLGVASYKNADLDSAAQYATKAAAARPEDLKALELLAEVDVKLAHWRDAEPVFERILSIKSGDETALLGLGHCELSLKQYGPAAATLEQVVNSDPTQVLAHFYLSRAYTGLGRTADAQHEAELHAKLLEQSASIVPEAEREVEKQTLVAARQLLTDDHEAEALQLFRDRAKGPTATPGAPYMLIGVVYLYMGSADDAERCLRHSLAIEPSVRGAHTYLGLLALQRADLDTAEAEFKTELAGEPNYQLAVAELGEVRYHQGRWQDAADQLAKSRTVNPGLLYMLCDAYFHLGEVKEADLTAELIADYAKDDREMVQRTIELLGRNQQIELAQRLSSR